MSSLLSCRRRPVWTLSLVAMQPISSPKTKHKDELQDVIWSDRSIKNVNVIENVVSVEPSGRQLLRFFEIDPSCPTVEFQDLITPFASLESDPRSAVLCLFKKFEMMIINTTIIIFPFRVWFVKLDQLAELNDN